MFNHLLFLIIKQTVLIIEKIIEYYPTEILFLNHIKNGFYVYKYKQAYTNSTIETFISKTELIKVPERNTNLILHANMGNLNITHFINNLTPLSNWTPNDIYAYLGIYNTKYSLDIMYVLDTDIIEKSINLDEKIITK